MSCGEAYALEDFDEATVKASYADAVKKAASAADGSPEKGIATVEVNTLSDLGRAMGVAL